MFLCKTKLYTLINICAGRAQILPNELLMMLPSFDGCVYAVKTVVRAPNVEFIQKSPAKLKFFCLLFSERKVGANIFSLCLLSRFFNIPERKLSSGQQTHNFSKRIPAESFSLCLLSLFIKEKVSQSSISTFFIFISKRGLSIPSVPVVAISSRVSKPSVILPKAAY